MANLNNLTTTEKYAVIGNFTKDVAERKILGQRYVDGMTNEEIIRANNGDDFLDAHSERIRKKKIDGETKKYSQLFESFEEFVKEN